MVLATVAQILDFLFGFIPYLNVFLFSFLIFMLQKNVTLYSQTKMSLDPLKLVHVLLLLLIQSAHGLNETEAHLYSRLSI